MDVFLFLTDPLSEVSVSEKKYLVLDYSKTLEPDLETKFGLEHLNCFTLVHPRDVHVRPLETRVEDQAKYFCHLHVDQGVVRDGKPLREVQSKSLFSICEDVPGHLRESANQPAVDSRSFPTIPRLP